MGSGIQIMTSACAGVPTAPNHPENTFPETAETIRISSGVRQVSRRSDRPDQDAWVRAAVSNGKEFESVINTPLHQPVLKHPLLYQLDHLARLAKVGQQHGNSNVKTGSLSCLAVT